MLSRPKKSKWNSFIGVEGRSGRVRGLEEELNPKHRARVEYSAATILVHLSDENGRGWTVMAVDRATRKWAVAQAEKQMSAVQQAFDALYLS
jgi:hypothetical protein